MTEPAQPLTVLSMKWGSKYTAQDVNVLHRMVARHLAQPFRFVCFTEDGAGLEPSIEVRPLPEIDVPTRHDVSPWRKVALFRPDLLDWTGRGLFLDLDVVVTGPLDDIAAYSDRLTLPENWTQKGKGIGNSSVFAFPIGGMGYVYERYCATKDSLFGQFSNEQTFVSKVAAEKGDLTFLPEAWVRSFKVDCMPWGPLNWLVAPRLPSGARVVAFHGNPKPSDAARGVYPGKWYKAVRPTPWVADHWR